MVESNMHVVVVYCLEQFVSVINMVQMQTSTVCNRYNASSSNLVFGIDLNVMPLGVCMSMSCAVPGVM